jgi:hypothetical protein
MVENPKDADFIVINSRNQVIMRVLVINFLDWYDKTTLHIGAFENYCPLPQQSQKYSHSFTFLFKQLITIFFRR